MLKFFAPLFFKKAGEKFVKNNKKSKLSIE